jgi:hypothetical protein
MDDLSKTGVRNLVWIYGEPSSVIQNGSLFMHKEQKYREGKDEKNEFNEWKELKPRANKHLKPYGNKVPFV